MNSYGTTRSIVTQLVPGEPAKAKQVKGRIARSSRHFSLMRGAEIGTDGRLHNEGAAKYDLLALDSIPRDVTGSRVETRLNERYTTPEATLVKTWQSFNGFRFTPSTAKLAEIREANSTDHLLNPTGGNVCPKCGYDKYCTCPPPAWAKPQKVEPPRQVPYTGPRVCIPLAELWICGV